MPRSKGEPTREDMEKAEKEVGRNIPQEMVGLDSEDARSPDDE